jgi:hypothetical protein
MTDPFILSVHHNNQEWEFTAELLLQGYSHKFKVMIGQHEVFFEPDEEGHYRAVKMPWQDQQDLGKIDRSLLSAIQQKIESILS